MLLRIRLSFFPVQLRIDSVVQAQLLLKDLKIAQCEFRAAETRRIILMCNRHQTTAESCFYSPSNWDFIWFVQNFILGAGLNIAQEPC